MNERENNILKNEKLVNCPNEADTSIGEGLSAAKIFPLWQYDKKVSELDAMDKQIREKFQHERETLLKSQQKSALNLMEFIKNDAYGEEKPLDEQVFRCIRQFVILLQQDLFLI